MCLAIPGRIVSINGMSSLVNFDGVERTVPLDLLPDSQVGDFVLVHAGFAIQQLDIKEAKEILSLLRQVTNQVNENNPGDRK